MKLGIIFSLVGLREVYYNVLQLPTVGDAKIHNTRRSRVVYFSDDTTRSEAELCMHQIHHEVKLSCVSSHTPRSEAELCMLAYPYSKQLENNIIQRLGPAAVTCATHDFAQGTVRFFFGNK